jgi:Polyketide cyclase / dehydrase and lipid transport.
VAIFRLVRKCGIINMDYLVYIIGIIVTLVIGFLALGLIKRKITYDREILVDKPVEEAGHVAQDEERMSEWLEGFKKIEHVSGTPKTVGNVSNVYFTVNGKEMVVKRTITAIKLFESMESLSETDFMNMEYTVKMTAIGNKTKISSSTTVKGNGIFAKSLLVFMGSSLKKQEEKNLIKLKNTIENTRKYF